MNYNIWVKLQSFEDKTRTSSSDNVARKNNKTSTGKKKHSTSSTIPLSPNKAKSFAIGALGVMAAAKMLQGVQKVANTGSKVLNNVTGNDYRAQRQQDYISMLNPLGFANKYIKTAFSNHFRVLRENKKIDYQRKITGMSLPNRNDDDDGITF